MIQAWHYLWASGRPSGGDGTAASDRASDSANSASQVSGQASLTGDGLARTRAYCAVSGPRRSNYQRHDGDFSAKQDQIFRNPEPENPCPGAPAKTASRHSLHGMDFKNRTHQEGLLCWPPAVSISLSLHIPPTGWRRTLRQVVWDLVTKGLSATSAPHVHEPDRGIAEPPKSCSGTHLATLAEKFRAPGEKFGLALTGVPGGAQP